MILLVRGSTAAASDRRYVGLARHWHLKDKEKWWNF